MTSSWSAWAAFSTNSPRAGGTELTDDACHGDRDLHASFLALKSALFDRNTGLYAFPYHFDELQRMVEWRPSLGLVHLEVFDFEKVEWLCGWQTFDGILRGMAREL